MFATSSSDLLIEVHDIALSPNIWDFLAHRFSGASLARAMDLERTLITLSKDETQSMEDYLRGII